MRKYAAVIDTSQSAKNGRNPSKHRHTTAHIRHIRDMLKNYAREHRQNPSVIALGKRISKTCKTIFMQRQTDYTLKESRSYSTMIRWE